MNEYRSIFVDTWGWVVLGQRQDSYHEQVKGIYQELITNKVSIYTSDYVLDEVMTLLFKREVFEDVVMFMTGIFTAIDRRQVKIQRVTSGIFLEAWELRKRLEDKPLISFTDLTSMVIMKQQNIQHVLTQDKHFIQVGMGFIRVPEDLIAG
ncbi:MAG: PIN domain-containing protein [Crinalium sp.]